jgi:hypothetical protein
MPVADGEPGEVVQLDTGWVCWLTLVGRKPRFRPWIFTDVRSRHRFVYPTFEEMSHFRSALGTVLIGCRMREMR